MAPLHSAIESVNICSARKKKLFPFPLPGYVEDANRLCQIILLTVHNKLHVLYSEKQTVCAAKKWCE